MDPNSVTPSPELTNSTPSQPATTATEPAVNPMLQTPQPLATPTSQSPSPVVTATSPVVEVTQKHRLPKWLLIAIAVIGGIVVILGLIIGLALYATSAAAQVSDSFMHDMKINDAKDSYALLSTKTQLSLSLADNPTKPSTYNETLWPSVVKALHAVLESYTLTYRSVSSTAGSSPQAVMIYTLHTSAGNAYMKILLQQNNGKWVITDYQGSTDEPNTSYSL